MTEDSLRALWSGFARSADDFPDRPAVEVAGAVATYRELDEAAKRIAAAIQRYSPRSEVPLTAVFAYRSHTAYAGILGALMAGNGYVPLNRTFPVERTKQMLVRSMCRSLVVDAASEPQLEGLLDGITDRLLLIFPDRAEVDDLFERFSAHHVIGAADLCPAAEWHAVETSPESIAYLLFTSGSTGQPKGVMVSHQNVTHYVNYVTERYNFTSADRLSQTFDMTFDLSVHDMFVAWESGACVCCPSQKELFKPDGFIKNSGLTVWFSVPSTAIFMRRLGLLKADSYPNLRLSLFCGEALPVQTVTEWAAAAPHSEIENIYGPTELTIACTAYRWDPVISPAQAEEGIVPIGEPFTDMQVLIGDEDLREVAVGCDGELLLAGPQVTLGYWQDEEKTRRAFVIPPGESSTYYRTGDRVRRAALDQPIVYLGRLDSQVKISGHRVELGEVEARIRALTGVEGVVAVGWPQNLGGADGIEAFVQSDGCDTKSLIENLRATLPAYMVPRRIHVLPRFPLNANGKFDRPALTILLQTTL